MILDALLDPRDLVDLTDRDLTILRASIRSELLRNPKILSELSSSIEPHMEALGRKPHPKPKPGIK